MNRNLFATTALTVSELTQLVKQRLEGDFPALCVQGEISNFRLQSSGHAYFSLKDAESQISVVMFRASIASLDRIPKDGDQVIVTGQLNVYVPRGQYQIVVRTLRHSGVGELLLKLEECKNKLKARGWFEQKRKKPLPPIPKKIGIVTSPTGAALQDMLNILRRRQGAFHLILNPVRVQGAEASVEIAQAIRQFNEHRLVDVMIVGRGGGSIEDLWPFNEEIVAEAIVNSQIPVISAIGHETDWTIADFVADLRAPTPSAAAELVMAERSVQLNFLTTSQMRLQHTLRHLLARTRSELRRFQRHPVFLSPYHLLGSRIQKCDDLKAQLERGMRGYIDRRALMLRAYISQVHSYRPSLQIKQNRTRLEELSHALMRALTERLDRTRERFEHVQRHLQSVNPKNLLTKGYAILFAEKRKRVVLSACALSAGEQVDALLADGYLNLTVNSVETS